MLLYAEYQQGGLDASFPMASLALSRSAPCHHGYPSQT